MTNEKLIDIHKSGDANFNNILNITKQTLDEATIPFLNLSACNTSEEFIELMKYDYISLYSTIVGSLLYGLSTAFATRMPKYETERNMPSIDTGEFHDDDMNRQRKNRIYTDYCKRNEVHAQYLNSPEYTPVTHAADALWYSLLSDFPILKRFLLKEEAIITKRFFDDLNSIYYKINTYSGYDRFFLLHKLEMQSKLEMSYKFLSLIKKEKRRKKLSDMQVHNTIAEISNFHIMSYNLLGYEFVLCNNIALPPLFHEAMQVLPTEKTINSIVFNVDSLINYYFEHPSVALDFINMLNFIHNAVVAHLGIRIETELSDCEPQIGFRLIKDIQHCDAASEFFNTYINDNVIINFNKDCGKDITFTHFKKFYKLKPEKKKDSSLKELQ